MVFPAVLHELRDSACGLEFQKTCRIGFLWYEENVGQMRPPLVINGSPEGSFTELKPPACFFSKNNTATRSRWTVSERDRNVRIDLIGNRYGLDFFRQTVRLMVVYYHLIHDSRVNGASEKRKCLFPSLTQNRNKLNGVRGHFVGGGDTRVVVQSTEQFRLNVLRVPFG